MPHYLNSVTTLKWNSGKNAIKNKTKIIRCIHTLNIMLPFCSAESTPARVVYFYPCNPGQETPYLVILLYSSEGHGQ